MAADPSFFVGIVGNIISILVFTSPIGTFRRVVRNKSTEEFRWLPYVTTLLATSLWAFYGLLKPGGLLIVTVNGAGAALQAIYVVLYLAYAPRETKIKMAKVVLAVNIVFFAAVIVVGLVALHGAVRLFAVGLLCAALTVGMYAAPMAAMVKDGGEDEERGVHALLPVLLPLPQRRHLERLLNARQGLLHRDPQRHRFRDGLGAAGAVHGIPEQEEGCGRGAQGGRRGRGERGGAPNGAGGAVAEESVVEEGAEPADAVVAAVPAPWLREPHQGLVRHAPGAPLCHAPARARRDQRQGRGTQRRPAHLRSSKRYLVRSTNYTDKCRVFSEAHGGRTLVRSTYFSIWAGSNRRAKIIPFGMKMCRANNLSVGFIWPGRSSCQQNAWFLIPTGRTGKAQTNS